MRITVDTQIGTTEDLATSLATARSLAARNHAARAALDETNEALERHLDPAIGTWHETERVPCGHTGGWSLDTEHEEGIVNAEGEVRLIHECFYAHRYDLHHTYNTTVPLDRLLGASS